MQNIFLIICSVTVFLAFPVAAFLAIWAWKLNIYLRCVIAVLIAVAMLLIGDMVETKAPKSKLPAMGSITRQN